MKAGDIINIYDLSERCVYTAEVAITWSDGDVLVSTKNVKFPKHFIFRTCGSNFYNYNHERFKYKYARTLLIEKYVEKE